LWMPLLMKSAQSASTAEQPKKVIPEDKKTSKPFSLSDSIKSGLYSCASGTYNVFHDVFCTKESWVSFFQFTFSQTAAGILMHAAKEHMHPDTLRWYIYAYAPYHKTIELMKEAMDDVHNQVPLSFFYQRLVDHAEGMSGYMMYKIKHLDNAEKKIAEQAKNALIVIHAKYLNEIKNQLDAESADFLILETLDDYQKAVTKQVNHFALAEGETPQQKASAKKRATIRE
jgi:hypothetical protein